MNEILKRNPTAGLNRAGILGEKVLDWRKMHDLDRAGVVVGYVTVSDIEYEETTIGDGVVTETRRPVIGIKPVIYERRWDQTSNDWSVVAFPATPDDIVVGEEKKKRFYVVPRGHYSKV